MMMMMMMMYLVTYFLYICSQQSCVSDGGEKTNHQWGGVRASLGGESEYQRGGVRVSDRALIDHMLRYFIYTAPVLPVVPGTVMAAGVCCSDCEAP